jgi:hypothetical protein
MQDRDCQPRARAARIETGLAETLKERLAHFGQVICPSLGDSLQIRGKICADDTTGIVCYSEETEIDLSVMQPCR